MPYPYWPLAKANLVLGPSTSPPHTPNETNAVAAPSAKPRSNLVSSMLSRLAPHQQLVLAAIAAAGGASTTTHIEEGQRRRRYSVATPVSDDHKKLEVFDWH